VRRRDGRSLEAAEEATPPGRLPTARRRGIGRTVAEADQREAINTRTTRWDET